MPYLFYELSQAQSVLLLGWHIKSDCINEEGLDWNVEVFQDHLSEKQQRIVFHYFMHVIFIEDRIYSFEDLLRMKADDFKVCL